MNLNHLSYFRVLGNTEHYTKAANELNITQPSLSHAIRALEEDLGTNLFERQGRNVKLTKYGKAFHKVVEHALTELEAGEKQLRNLTSEKGGQIDLGFIYTLGSFFVPIMISNFLKEHSDDNINFLFAQGATKDIINGLKTEQYDIGLCSYMEGEPDIDFVKIYQESLVIILPISHPLAGRNILSLEELKNESFVYYEKTSGIRPTIDNMFENAQFTPNVVCEVMEDTAIAGLVSIGYGIAVVPDTPLLNSFPIKKAAITGSANKRFVYMATLKNHYLTPSVRKLYDFLLDHRKI